MTPHTPDRPSPATTRIPAVIVGVAGYTGQELVRLIAAHPGLELVACFGTDRTAGSSLAELCPALRNSCDARTSAAPVRAASAPAIVDALASTPGESTPRVAFLATPHEASAELAPALADSGVLVADLSAAFRFPNPSFYPAFYGFEHPHHTHLADAVYGLPELTRDRLRALSGRGIIACAGCYVTSAVLALRPLARAGAIRLGTRPIIDATSGVSGAGRKAQAHTSFAEVSQSPYGVLTHRHRPEIAMHSGLSSPNGTATDIASAVVFQPHLGPYSRGILSTIHVELAPDWDEQRLAACYAAAYADEPFIRLLPRGTYPSVGAVERTNFADIAFAVERHAHGTCAVIFSALDNLLKGASSQALQCVNAALAPITGWSETLGLPPAIAPAAFNAEARP